MFKVGDKVRVIADNSHAYEKGHVGDVIEIDPSDRLIRVGPKAIGNWHHAKALELVEPEPESREATVSIDVDTTQLREAVELAERLADAMERIKAVFK